MKRYFCCILLICITLGFVKASQLRERVYVQTDKHLYLAGEQVLMKLITTDSDLIPLTFSKIAYVELTNDTIARLQITVELTNGTGTGQMILPVDLPTGYYRLIAYTQYMRNENVDVFFEKNIAILNTFQSGYQPNPELDPSNPQPSNFKPETSTLKLETNTPIYTTRTRGELILSDLPENIHTLSVSIAGKEFVPLIESNLSLFQKNQTVKSTQFSGEYLPEYEGHIVTGKIINNQTGNVVTGEVPLTAVIAFPTDNGIRFFAGQKNVTGNVRFFTSGISGTKEIASVVYDADEK